MEFDVEEEPKSPIDPNFDPDTETETESKSDVDEGDSQNVPRKKQSKIGVIFKSVDQIDIS